jgi:hypothetical protein
MGGNNAKGETSSCSGGNDFNIGGFTGMKQVTILAMALLCAFLFSPSTTNAATVLMNNFGYMYETGGFPNSDVGDILEGVGNVTSIDPSMACDLSANELTWTIRDLVSNGQIMYSGRYVVVSYSGGILNLHCDPAKNRNFGINPPNATAPATFEDGQQFLLGYFTQFSLFYDTLTQSGAFQGLVNFTTGTNLVDLTTSNGIIFAGTFGPSVDPNIPDGYSLEAVGSIQAPTLCTVTGNVHYVYDPGQCQTCTGISRLVMAYNGAESMAAAFSDNGTGLEVAGNQLIITPGSGGRLPDNTTLGVGLDAITLETSCLQPLEPGNTIGDFTVAAVDKDVVPCYEAECDGISELVVEYLGIGDPSSVATSEGVMAAVSGTTITLTPSGAKLPENTVISVGSDEATINTSCAQPLTAGLVFGAFQVASAEKTYPPIPDSGGIPSSGPIVGATVDLVDAEGIIRTTLTDENGDFIFYDVAGEDILVSVVTPAGYVALTPTELNETCMAGGTVVLDFAFERTGTCDMPRTIGFWKHNVNSALIGKSKGVQVSADELLDYFGQIHSRFDQYFSIFIPVVTMQDFSDVLTTKKNDGMFDKARTQFAATLLNVVSGRIATWQFVSVDHATASQAITYISNLMMDGDDSNDELAKDLAEMLNMDKEIPGGVIPLTIGQIAYVPPAQFDLRGANVPAALSTVSNYPNPFRSSTTIRYELTGELQVRLGVYNILGQRIRTLVGGEYRNGLNEAQWNGLDDAGQAVSSGVYFYRLQAGDQVVTKRMILVR